ncbi:MAG: CRISPR-associated endonuclease Cas1 [Alphaproteobacteria bacterium]|nr:CRISPR-associated endonuclease Cas1 [Alphaproteobacteria bacterium]
MPAASDRHWLAFQEASRLDALQAAWRRVEANAGAAGGDGITIAMFGRAVPGRLIRLQRDLRSGRYAPGPIRRVDIPKQSGGMRPLDIPCIVDRVAQTAIAEVLMPVLDAEMADTSFAYRPGRSVREAVARIERHRADGFTHVVDGDIERYFENVPHDPLLTRLEASIGPGPIIDLVALWLESASTIGRGLPQGAPVSPLLANLYLDDFDDRLARRGIRLVRFADDFLVLCKSAVAAEASLERVRTALEELGLRLHPEKSRIVSFDQGFRFLGHLFVRSLTLPSPNRLHVPALDALLAQVAAQDRREAEAKSAAERREAAGYAERMRVLYVTVPGRRLSLRNRAFTVMEEDEELIALPHRQVDRIDIGPEAMAEDAALRLAIATDTQVAWVNGTGQTLGWAGSGVGPRAGRQLAQARHVLDPALRVELARCFVDGRLRNQRAVLRRLNRSKKDRDVINGLIDLNRSIRKTSMVPDVPGLLGHEGRATALYWPALSRLLAPPWTLEQRRRRPSPDPVNAMLSFAAGLLERDVTVFLVRHGLNPGFGFLHGSADNHAGCVFDLMEVFRAPLVESLVVYLCNNDIVHIDMFAETPDGTWRMGREAQHRIVRTYEAWADRLVTSQQNGPDGAKRRVTWRGVMEEQVLSLCRHIEDQEAYRPYVIDY